MSIVKRIVKNILYLTVGEMASKAQLFLLAILIARYLGSGQFGNYSFAFSFTVLFHVIADIGLNRMLARDLPREKEKLGEYMYNIISLKIILSTIALASIYLIINLTQITTEVKTLVYLAGLYMICESYYTLFRNIFIAFEESEFEAQVIILEKIIIIILGYIVLVNEIGLFWLMIAYLVGGIIRNIVGLTVVLVKFKPKFEMNPQTFWPFIMRAYPFCLTNLLAVIYVKIDITMLLLMKGNDSVGWYSAAYNLIYALMLIPAVFMSAVLPNMTRFYLNNKNALLKSFELSIKYLIIIAIPLTLGGILVSEKLITIMYGKTFENSIIIFQILLGVVLLYFIKGPLNAALYASNNEKKIMWAYYYGLFTNVTLNFIFIPKWGYLAAGINTVFSEIITLSIIIYWFNKLIGKTVISRYFTKPLLSSIVMITYLLIINKSSLLISISTGLTIYFITLYFMGGFSEEDIKLFKESVRIN